MASLRHSCLVLISWHKPRLWMHIRRYCRSRWNDWCLAISPWSALFVILTSCSNSICEDLHKPRCLISLMSWPGGEFALSIFLIAKTIFSISVLICLFCGNIYIYLVKKRSWYFLFLNIFGVLLFMTYMYSSFL